jgi:hypothetical protein
MAFPGKSRRVEESITTARKQNEQAPFEPTHHFAKALNQGDRGTSEVAG